MPLSNILYVDQPVISGTADRVLYIGSTGLLAQSSQFLYSEDGSGNPSFQINKSGSRLINIDALNNSYTFGDIDGFGGNNYFHIDDASNQYIFNNTANNGRIDLIASTSAAGPAYFKFLNKVEINTTEAVPFKAINSTYGNAGWQMDYIDLFGGNQFPVLRPFDQAGTANGLMQGGLFLNGDASNSFDPYLYFIHGTDPSVQGYYFLDDDGTLYGYSTGNTQVWNGSFSCGASAQSVCTGLWCFQTTEQMRLGHDSSNYVSDTVSSTGKLTKNATGSALDFASNFMPTIGKGLAMQQGYYIN